MLDERDMTGHPSDRQVALAGTWWVYTMLSEGSRLLPAEPPAEPEERDAPTWKSTLLILGLLLLIAAIALLG